MGFDQLLRLVLRREEPLVLTGPAGFLDNVAGKLAPFHFSPRYEGRHEELIQEAAEAFGGPVAVL